MDSMRIALVQNHGVEDADLVAAVLQARGVACLTVNSFRDEPMPGVGDFDAVVVFGSPASCTELDRYPRLLRVRDLVAECVSHGRPVLGICFGGQLLAQVLGAEVRKNDLPEVGCFDVRLTAEGRRSPWFAGFPDVFPTAQWHYDRFGIPPGAEWLASSERCPHQAFSLGPHVGLQLHLEASQRKVQDWLSRYHGSLPDAGKPPEELSADFARTAAERERLCDLFMVNFLRAVNG